MEHVQRAQELFLQGYSCAQAVFGAFTDVTGMDFKTSMRLASSFGAGMGRMREVCGACSAMFMIVGLVSGYSDASDANAKREHYARIQRLADEFRKEHSSIISTPPVK